MNKKTFRAVFLLAYLLFFAVLVVAQKKGTLSFTLSMEHPSEHTYHVEMSYGGAMGETVDLKMPMWTPGYYGILDFPKNVGNFRVVDEQGRPLPWEKTTENCWRVCSHRAGRIAVSYDVLATSPFVASCYLDEDRGYIMPAGMFLHIAGVIQQPVTLVIKPYRSWRDIATALERVPGKRYTYAAPDFDVLYDSPILIGNLERLPTFTIRGIPHDFIGYRLGEFDRQQFIRDLAAVIEAGTNIIGAIPYKHYTFIAIGPGQGGIEHLSSTSFGFNGGGLSTHPGKVRTLSFLAHEYFHHYNVKRIRPIALGPFDYDQPNLTTMLWVSEGFTVYYEYLMLARSGMMTREELLEALGRSIAAYENSTGHLFQSATQSSYESWEQGPFGRRGKGVVKTISYYDKGPVLGWLLDLKIRHETRNARSLDDVMRTLYREFYRGKGRGFTDQEFRDGCERVAGVPLTEIFEYASTTEAIDYAKYLAYAGIELEPPKETQSPYLGAVVEEKGGDHVIAAVEEGSPAFQASLHIQDTLKLLDGASVAQAQWSEAIAAQKPGDTVRLTVASTGTHARVVSIVLGHKMERSYRMTTLTSPDSLQEKILQGLMKRE
jgi:predicted metalloprotease with PDZ domain